jgi:hypothetical protein
VSRGSKPAGFSSKFGVWQKDMQAKGPAARVGGECMASVWRVWANRASLDRAHCTR